MAQEALKKCSQQERSVLELHAKLKGLMDENTELKEQLYSALEHHTTKSCDSGNSKVNPANLLNLFTYQACSTHLLRSGCRVLRYLLKEQARLTISEHFFTLLANFM